MANHERGREAEEDEDAAAAQREREEALKRQADALLLAERHEQALRLYRELLAHLTRSQVKLLLQRDLVISCHMNILAALSKLEQWPLVVADATTTLNVIRELQDEAVRQHLEPKDPVLYDHVQARVFYFRGFARFRLGAFGAADADFKEAMKFAPEDESIREDYEELQAAVQAELKVQQLLSAAIKQFQARKYKLAIETCTAALCDSQSLGKDDLTGLIHGNLAAILVKAKDDVRAVEHYKRALLFAQKTVAPAGNPTQAQHERIFDLLDALAGCYSRRKDYSSALSVIDDQIRRFPDCPGRKDRESMMYLNGGRVCCTLGKFDQAEKHLRLAKAAASKAGQTEIELNAAYWLSRALSEMGNAVDAISVLDGAIPTAEQQQPENVELIGKLLLARLEWLNPTQPGKDEAPKELTPKRIAQLWHTYDYFEKKRYVHGQLCACDALVSALCSVNSTEPRSIGTSSSDEVQESEVFRALRVVDTVSIGKLPVEDASILIRLVFLKVDLLLVDPQRRHEAKMLLAKTLRSLQTPGRNEVSRRQKFRAAALHRLVEIVQCEAGEEDPDEEVYEYLEEATDLLRREKDTDPSASVALGELLRRIARFKASRGEVEDAEVLLQESAELPGGQVIPALLPLCVVQLRQGKLHEAGKTMKLMETLADANEWKELAVIKDQLNAAAKAKEETRRASKRKGSKGTQKDADVDTGTVSTAACWWERYLWLPLSLCAVLVATLVALWL